MSAWRRPTTGAPCRCSMGRHVVRANAHSIARMRRRSRAQRAGGGYMAGHSSAPSPRPPHASGGTTARVAPFAPTSRRAEKKILTVIDRRPKAIESNVRDVRAPRAAGGGVMNSFIGRHPVWSLVIVILIAIAAVPDLRGLAARARAAARPQAHLPQRAAQRHHARRALLPGGERLHADLRPDAQRQPGARLALSVRRLFRLRDRAAGPEAGSSP